MKTQTDDQPQSSKFKKIVNIIVNVLFFLFFIICVFALYLSISTKKNSDDATEIFGYEARIVLTSSMEKCDLTDVSNYQIKDIPVKSMVFIKTVPQDEQSAEEFYSQLKVGDVLTFKYTYSSQVTITHRIVEITKKETGGYRIVLEGDNKVSEDNVGQQIIDTSIANSTNYVIGKVTGTSVVLGYFITAVKSTWGIILIVIVPCLIIIILDIIRIVDIVSQKKKEALLKEQQKKDEEIEQLKKLLAQANSNHATEQDKNITPTAGQIIE
jgi:ABC-type multidrug transport system fused ATPase/permease subunit